MKPGAVRAIYIHQIMADDESVPITISTGTNSTDVLIRALPNTGSQLEAISNSIFQSQFEGVTLSPSRAEKTATGSTINCLGIVRRGFPTEKTTMLSVKELYLH
jgi:hypothetical protein